MKASGGFDPRRLLAYPKLYRKFQRLVQSRDSATRLVDDFLKIIPGQRVLDIGCGTADILAQLPLDIDYYGYDIEPGSIASAPLPSVPRGSFVFPSFPPAPVYTLGTF